MAIETKEDVNERFPSGYYFYTENGKNILINGINHTIRELNGKKLTKIPSIIICTKNKNGTSYVSNRDRPVDSFMTIQSHYKKVIDKKEYSYDFSNFYYIEGESAPADIIIPTKMLLHNAEKDYPYGDYNYSKIDKVMTKLISGKFNISNIFDKPENNKFYNTSITNDNYIGNYSGIDYFINVKEINGNLSFKKINDTKQLYDYHKIIVYTEIGPSILEDKTKLVICFSFNNNILKKDISIESISNQNYFTIKAFHISDKLKKIDDIKSTEPYQYGIYQLRKPNNYIALKFDINDALPTFIQNLYTKEPCEQSNPSMKAYLLERLDSPGGKKNIITPTETITEVYVINYY